MLSDIDECAGAPCLNGGTCTDGVNGFTCACVDGYSGDTCATSEWLALCMCAPLGDCSSACLTPPRSPDRFLVFADIDECAGAPCLNGGTCTDGVNGFTCACVTGYIGDECETSEWLARCVCAPLGDCGSSL